MERETGQENKQTTGHSTLLICEAVVDLSRLSFLQLYSFYQEMNPHNTDYKLTISGDKEELLSLLTAEILKQKRLPYYDSVVDLVRLSQDKFKLETDKPLVSINDLNKDSVLSCKDSLDLQSPETCVRRLVNILHLSGKLQEEWIYTEYDLTSPNVGLPVPYSVSPLKDSAHIVCIMELQHSIIELLDVNMDDKSGKKFIAVKDEFKDLHNTLQEYTAMCCNIILKQSMTLYQTLIYVFDILCNRYAPWNEQYERDVEEKFRNRERGENMEIELKYDDMLIRKKKFTKLDSAQMKVFVGVLRQLAYCMGYAAKHGTLVFSQLISQERDISYMDHTEYSQSDDEELKKIKLKIRILYYCVEYPYRVLGKDDTLSDILIDGSLEYFEGLEENKYKELAQMNILFEEKYLDKILDSNSKYGVEIEKYIDTDRVTEIDIDWTENISNATRLTPFFS